MGTIGAAAILLGIAMTGANADRVTLREEARVTEATRATIGLKAEGTFKPATLPGSPEAKPLALKVESRLEFVEKVIEIDAKDQARRVLRQVEQASATINGEVRPSTSALRPDVSTLVAERRGNQVSVSSPNGPLTRSELELVQGPGDPLVFLALLPTKPVAVGDHWLVGELAARNLSGYDALAANALEANLESFTDDSARIKLIGTIRGAALGGEGSMACDGSFTFDRRANRVEKLILRRAETRRAGPIEDGLDVKSELTVARSTVPLGKPFDDQAFVTKASERNPGLDLLLFNAPNDKYSLLHDREWHLYWDDARQAVLKRLDRGEMVAQCNISVGPNAGKGRHQDLGQFREDIRKVLGERFVKFVGEGEVEGVPAGGFRYKVTVQGKQGDSGVLWHYYLIAGPEGDQLIVTFTLGIAQQAQFAEQDLKLIGSLDGSDLPLGQFDIRIAVGTSGVAPLKPLRASRAAFLLPALLNALTGGVAQGQEPPAAEVKITSTRPKTQKIADLTSRYRFSEKYTTDDEHTGPGVVGSYRVAIFESIKDSFDNPQGAPRRTESSRQSIFTERPSEMSGVGSVASVSRTFEKFRAKPEDASKTMGWRPLEGLSVLIKPRQGDLAQILSLTEGRPLTEFEYDIVAHQVFIPHLATLLPSQVVRIGDTWRLSKKATQALLGDPFLQSDSLTAKLDEIRKEVDGPRLVASITITGKVSGPLGDTAVNAEVLFTFVGESSLKGFSTKSSFPPRPTEDITESRGSITELRLTKVTSGPLAGTGKLRYQSNREITLHRQIGLVAGAVPPPVVAKAPELTEANTWLVHVDPAGRYAFRHSQELLLPAPTQPAGKPETSLLVRSRRDGTDMLQVEYVRKILTPADLQKELADKYAMMKMEVIKGDEEWLPEADWPRMKVHRIQADVKVGDPKSGGSSGSTRIHYEGYLILFGQKASVLAISTTSRDAAGTYRKEVEQILKSIQLDPPRPAVN